MEANVTPEMLEADPELAEQLETLRTIAGNPDEARLFRDEVDIAKMMGELERLKARRQDTTRTDGTSPYDTHVAIKVKEIAALQAAQNELRRELGKPLVEYPDLLGEAGGNQE